MSEAEPEQPTKSLGEMAAKLTIALPIVSDPEAEDAQELYATAEAAAAVCVDALGKAGFGDLASALRVLGETEYTLQGSGPYRVSVSFDVHHARPRVEE